MEITAGLVKELREKTGVGMMDCKKALANTNGNFEEAIKYLREKGLSAASKKSDRATQEGRVFTAVSADNTQGIIVEVNCETDFVANNQAFLDLGNGIAEALLNSSASSLDEVAALTVNGKSLNEVLSEAVLKLGENITVKRFERFSQAGQLASYIHMNGKIGVLVSFNGEVEAGLGRDIAMQIAASQPLYVRQEEVPAAEIEKESEIIRNQALNEGKPAAILDKVVAGKISKFFKDICLVEQAFIKDQDKTIKQLLTGSTTVVKFSRYSLN